MNSLNQLLQAAEAFKPSKAHLAPYKDVIIRLRSKGASWREIAKFLHNEANLEVEHTKIARTAASWNIESDLTASLPLTTDFLHCLNTTLFSHEEKQMLLSHYYAPHRTVSYSQLAQLCGHDSSRQARQGYSELGKKLCDALQFAPLNDASGRPSYTSIIGIKHSYTRLKDEYQLIMHHALSDAIRQLIEEGRL
ncbi:hypothetical protein [Neptuniibacter sp. CAU 1671]|uniref:hypothetical protein n=1 Tax=Neptuniibacter sp. CAU 1671 TaxID=3032593 RepID=UPI0023DA4CD2|nr:hypothetical protein [Neptuniibacter sp. CAU 1671]MDF2182517.1 hypothetical protein [Neptuniibacter sp. CAU 1671]